MSDLNWRLESSDGIRYASNEIRWRSDNGALLDLKAEFSSGSFSVDDTHQGLWRYKAMLPVTDPENIVSFGEGITPVVREKINGKNCIFKLEYLFPTGSYKDRGATVLVSKIKELGINEIVEDSSGNAGAAISAYAAKARISCEILVPETTSQGKLKQLESYGAIIRKIKGSRKDVSDEALKIAQSKYYASHSWNPYFFHGTKTFAYEIADQLGGDLPKTIIMPAGNGTLFMGTYIGFSELLSMNRISFIPRLVAVQAANCSPLSGSTDFSPTIAEGIAVQYPVRLEQILSVIVKTGGELITVSEAEINEAWRLSGKLGYFIEKTSAAGVAGLLKSNYNESVLLPLTGSGLKI